MTKRKENYRKSWMIQIIVNKIYTRFYECFIFPRTGNHLTFLFFKSRFLDAYFIFCLICWIFFFFFFYNYYFFLLEIFLKHHSQNSSGLTDCSIFISFSGYISMLEYLVLVLGSFVLYLTSCTDDFVYSLNLITLNTMDMWITLASLLRSRLIHATTYSTSPFGC